VTLFSSFVGGLE